MEYDMKEFMGVFVQAGYNFIPLKEEVFIYGEKFADFHAISLN